LTDQVIGLEKIQVVRLDCQLVVLAWVAEWEEKAIVPGAFAILVTEVSIRVLPVIRLEEDSDKAISGAFRIHHLQILGVPHNNTNFKLFLWLLGDIPHWAVLFGS